MFLFNVQIDSSFGAQDTPLLAAGRNAQGQLDWRYPAACCGWECLFRSSIQSSACTPSMFALKLAAADAISFLCIALLFPPLSKNILDICRFDSCFDQCLCGFRCLKKPLPGSCTKMARTAKI